VHTLTRSYSHFAVAVRLAMLAVASLLAGSLMPDMSKVMTQTKRNNLAVQVGGWTCGWQLHLVKSYCLDTSTKVSDKQKPGGNALRRLRLDLGCNATAAYIYIYLVHETATYRCDDTRGCIVQFWPLDDKHMCSKHLKAWNKLIVKQIFFCIKLVNYWDKRMQYVF